MKGHIEDILVGGRPMTKNEIKIKELQDRIDKAIEYIENHIIATETEDILLDILKGE